MDNSHAIIVAHDQSLGIGRQNQLPWHIKEDLKFFRKITCDASNHLTQNALIMGRKTWESLPQTFRPLPERLNVVLTKNPDYPLPKSVIKSKSIEEALSILADQECSRIFIIGGAAIYQEAIKMKDFRSLYVTEIEGTHDCDTFFPEYRNNFTLVDSSPLLTENQYQYCHKLYSRKE